MAGGAPPPGAVPPGEVEGAVQRPAAETLYAEELRRLETEDGDAPRPAGWRLTPRSVLRFVLGDEGQGISAEVRRHAAASSSAASSPWPPTAA